MADTIKIYQDKQQKLIALLNKLNLFVKQGNQFGLDLPREMYVKLENINKKADEKLKIALIGGFSEGKTSIAAAWLGKLDKSSMKISAAESSNEVTVYDIDNECVLIDTPGLYGFKSQENDDFQIEKYKDITKKYVSEAHIILYVMNSKNPIKESHKEDLIWLFNELNLLSRTIFVLSRFDEVADVEDEREYQYHLKIKQDNVKGRLQEFLGLSQEQVGQLSIVGISANPFDEGIEYWLQNPQEFEQLSHIVTLQNATKAIVEYNGGINEIANETRKTIFSDILLQEIPKIEQKNDELQKVSNELEHLFRLQNGELEQLIKHINHARGQIKMQLNGYFSDLLMQLNGLGLEAARNFLATEIGKEGAVMNSNIQQIFFNETAGITSSLNHQVINFNAKLDNIDSAANQMMKKGVNHLIKNVKLDNSIVLAARDGIRNVAGMAGIDLAKAMKFKPYGAIKFANKLNGAFAMLGLVMEVLDSYKKAKMEEEFQEAIRSFKNDIQDQQKELLTFIDDSNKFIPAFFQGYLALQSAVQKLDEQKQAEQKRLQSFYEWKKQGEVIEAEFRELNSL
ncbi:TPA: dynamin family protein, partial [Pasteurella multocida]|nr:dynamin family protein [Pasteurella multocida]HED4484239.1 dynamin family protein [Pasteurella multocida]